MTELDHLRHTEAKWHQLTQSYKAQLKEAQAEIERLKEDYKQESMVSTLRTQQLEAAEDKLAILTEKLNTLYLNAKSRPENAADAKSLLKHITSEVKLLLETSASKNRR